MTIQVIIMFIIFGIGAVIAWVGDKLNSPFMHVGTAICILAFLYFIVSLIITYVRNVRK